jgi:hypothetical protein
MMNDAPARRRLYQLSRSPASKARKFLPASSTSAVYSPLTW